MKAHVFVSLKPGVLDPQGKAVLGGLRHLGHEEVLDVRVGKWFTVELRDGTPDPEGRVEEMCRQLLANVVIEEFRVETDGR